MRDAKVATAAPEFRPNEWLEALIRCREGQPHRYAREVAEGTRARVEAYEREKRERSRRAAA